MSEPDKAEVIRVLREIGALLELKGESVYKTRAYEKGADSLTQYQGSLRQLVDEGRLEELPGFGKALVAKVSELVQTGVLPYHQALLQEFPASLLQVVQVPGVGPKKAAALHRELGVVDLASLEAACQALDDLFREDEHLWMGLDGLVEFYGAQGTPWARFMNEMLNSQRGAEHARIRGSVAAAFTPRHANKMRPVMRNGAAVAHCSLWKLKIRFMRRAGRSLFRSVFV